MRFLRWIDRALWVPSRQWAALVVLVLCLCGCGLLPAQIEQANRAPTSTRATATLRATNATLRATNAPKATPRPTRLRATPRPSVAASPTLAAAPAAQAIPGFRVIAPDDLPPEAQYTIELIAANGPFPYRQDGAIFQNRERLLPRQPNGYYREYTVETPGSPDRGARRIIAGAQGEMFYTADHYDSFVQVIP